MRMAMRTYDCPPETGEKSLILRLAESNYIRRIGTEEDEDKEPSYFPFSESTGADENGHDDGIYELDVTD